SEGGIRRRRHLLEHVDAAMELAHPAGAEPLAPQPPQLEHFPARLIQRVLTRVSPAGLTRGSIFLRKNAFAKKMDCTATRACPSGAVLCAASRVNPTCGVKPGNDGSEIEASGKCFSRRALTTRSRQRRTLRTLFALGLVDAVPIRGRRST